MEKELISFTMYRNQTVACTYVVILLPRNIVMILEKTQWVIKLKTNIL